MEKRARELAVKERRARKEEKKRAKKLAASTEGGAELADRDPGDVDDEVPELAEP